MEIDTDRIDEAVLALLYLGLHDRYRAWKGFDWDAMDRLHDKGLISDPQLPFFIQWQSSSDLHPSNGATGEYSLDCLEIAGDPQRVSEWLGETVEAPLEDVKVEWVAPNGTPGIMAAQFQTPSGLVRI